MPNIRKNEVSQYLGCINVRYGALALTIGYLVIHILGLAILIYTSVNLDSIIAAQMPTLTRSDQVIDQNATLIIEQLAPESRVIGPARDDGTGGTEYVLVKQNLNVIKVNWMTYIVKFTLNTPVTVTDIPTESELHVAIAYSSVSVVVAVIAIFGIVKNLQGCLVPFFIGQILDFILSICLACGWDLHGINAKEDILVSSSKMMSRQSHDFNSLDGEKQTLFIAAQICKMLIKLYLMVIVWKCWVLMRGEKSRNAHKERQDRYTENLIQGKVIYDIIPPPSYQSASSVQLEGTA